MEIPLLTDVVIILGLSVLVLLLFQKLKLPTVLGFLITGLIAGPHGLSLVNAVHEIEILAEIGVILLLFIIGMEFSLQSLAAIKKAVLLGGAVQVLGTITVVTGAANLFGLPLPHAVFLGFLFALSSTAIVLKLLQERGEINSPHGRVILAILIFQDIAVVPMMLFTPMLTGETENVLTALLILALKGLLIIILVIISARYVVPKLLFLVAQTRSKELFILSIVVICFAVAWLTSKLGLSLALGAFMAGLIISESEYSHQATGNILPFREIFASFFFVSIGMLLDGSFLFNHLGWVVLLTLIVFFGKGFIAMGSALILKYPLRPALLTGIGLFQVGEFAFILSRTGLDSNLLSPITYQYFLSVSIMTMAITPFAMHHSHYLTKLFFKVFPEKASKRATIKKTIIPESVNTDNIKDHVVIFGFGVNGRNVAKAARFAGVPYLVLDMNARTVHTERHKGEPIFYGDAVHTSILHHLAIEKARVAVVAISDPVATKQIISNLRMLNSKIHLVVRTRFLLEIPEILRLGANEVVSEELETSIEVFVRVLIKYLVPRDEIEAFIRNVRADNYNMLRSLSSTVTQKKGAISELPDMEVAALKVTHSDPTIVGLDLEKTNLRKKFRVTLVAIKRNNRVLMDITAITKIELNDIIYVIGRPADIATLSVKLKI